jgi:type I restriction enzyme, S subunit
MRNLSQEGLRLIEVPWPNDQERELVVSRIETAFGWIGRLAAEASSGRKLIDLLDRVVLAKAFRGELVPQDPNDDPASVLLERIRATKGPSSVRTRLGG